MAVDLGKFLNVLQKARNLESRINGSLARTSEEIKKHDSALRELSSSRRKIESDLKLYQKAVSSENLNKLEKAVHRLAPLYLDALAEQKPREGKYSRKREIVKSAIQGYSGSRSTRNLYEAVRGEFRSGELNPKDYFLNIKSFKTYLMRYSEDIGFRKVRGTDLWSAREDSNHNEKLFDQDSDVKRVRRYTGRRPKIRRFHYEEVAEAVGLNPKAARSALDQVPYLRHYSRGFYHRESNI
jgi:hypothetical protein